MTGRNIKLVAGWGHEGRDCQFLGEKLSSYGKVEMTSVTELRVRNEVFSYATACRDMIMRSGEPCVLVGWSMGAMVALETLARFTTPISHVILIAGTSKFCNCSDYKAGVSVHDLKALRAGLNFAPQASLRFFLKRVGFPRDLPVETINAKAAEMMAVGIGTLNEGLLYLAQFDVRDYFSRMSVPTLAIHGKQDRIIPWQASEYIAGHIAGSKLCVHDEEGHRIPLDAPDVVASDIIDFLEENK
ncbi:MAG: alpha/beta hydrolase [Lentisphaerae bacterium]|nr:alpha/beta hydrolase [Lentisphaerota bacterium]